MNTISALGARVIGTIRQTLSAVAKLKAAERMLDVAPSNGISALRPIRFTQRRPKLRLTQIVCAQAAALQPEDTVSRLLQEMRN